MANRLHKLLCGHENTPWHFHYECLARCRYDFSDAEPAEQIQKITCAISGTRRLSAHHKLNCFCNSNNTISSGYPGIKVFLTLSKKTTTQEYHYSCMVIFLVAPLEDAA